MIFFVPIMNFKSFRRKHKRAAVEETIGSLSNNDGDGYKKRHLKSEFALLQTLSRLFHLVLLRQKLANVFGVEF